MTMVCIFHRFKGNGLIFEQHINMLVMVVAEDQIVSKLVA